MPLCTAGPAAFGDFWSRAVQGPHKSQHHFSQLIIKRLMDPSPRGAECGSPGPADMLAGAHHNACPYAMQSWH